MEDGKAAIGWKAMNVRNQSAQIENGAAGAALEQLNLLVADVKRFWVQFYGEEELVESALDLIKEARQLEPQLRNDHLAAYWEILNAPPEIEQRAKVLRDTPADFLLNLDNSDLVKVLKDLLSNLWTNLENLDLYKSRLDQPVDTDQGVENINPAPPKDAISWVHYGNNLQDNSHDQSGAEEAYRKALEIAPNSFEALFNLGRLLSSIPTRHEEAEHAYKRALSLKPKKGLVWMRLALLLQKEKRYEEAGNACSQAIEIVEQVRKTSNQIHQISLPIPEIEKERVESLKKSISALLKPASICYVGRGITYLCLHRYGESEQDYRRALELDPGCESASEGLAGVEEDRKVWQEKQEFLSRLLEDAETEETAVQNVTEFCIVAAAVGHGKEVLKLVSESKAAD